LLLWADYRELGGFHNALAHHAEFVFLNLKSDEQEALLFVIPELLTPSRGEDAFLNRRSIPYRDLVLHPHLNQRQRLGAKGLVDRLIEEGLLSAKIDPQQDLLISIPQDALLRRWPRLWELLSQDLDESQIDYIKKSLERHKPSRRVPLTIGAAAIAGLAIFGAFVGGERFNADRRRTNNEHDIRPAQQNTNLDARQPSQLDAERGALEFRLKETERRLQMAQRNADLDLGSGTQLKKTEEKPQIAQQNADVNAAQEHPAGDATKKEAPKKSTDPANELRSGRALTLDSSQNAEQGISTQGFTAPVQSPNH
jgi:hypothetical protein